MSRRRVLAVAASVLVAGAGVAYAVSSSTQTASCTSSPTITDGSTTRSIQATCSGPKRAESTTTTTDQPTTSAWPDASNTGVPAGVALTPYGSGGACDISTPGTVLDAKAINCDVVIRVAGVRITRSHVNGRIVSDSDSYPGASVSVTDSLIDGGQQETFPAVSYTGITLTRVEVIGGQHSVQCSQDCTVTDSWLHDQYLPRSSAGHVNAFISNGGSGFTLTHNTLDCSVDPTNSGGCTADLALFGDFGPIADVSIDRNLFVANHAAYCLQAGHNPDKRFPNATGVTVTRNVFERVGRDTTRCGLYGPVTAYSPTAAGNLWAGNAWDDGTPLTP